jgi:hypothetical protein
MVHEFIQTEVFHFKNKNEDIKFHDINCAEFNLLCFFALVFAKNIPPLDAILKAAGAGATSNHFPSLASLFNTP